MGKTFLHICFTVVSKRLKISKLLFAYKKSVTVKKKKNYKKNIQVLIININLCLKNIKYIFIVIDSFTEIF